MTNPAAATDGTDAHAPDAAGGTADAPVPGPVEPDQNPSDEPSFADVFAEAFAPDEPEPPRDLSGHDVQVVLVSHDGARWLPRTLAGIAAQTRPVDRVVAVDTGSTDSSVAVLTGALGDDALRQVHPDTGFAAAVHAGVGPRAASATSATRSWIWVLHDDSVPAADALERLLTAADLAPSLAVVGPKVLGWDDSRRLLEVGVTISGSGRRETGLERREMDQGQHDGQHDVLAVGSAGALIRRDVWDDLGGFDPQLPLFREDVDLGWRANLAGHRVTVVTDAVVRHVEAAARGRRAEPVDADRARLTDRRSALYVLLANKPGVWLPLVWVRLVAGSLIRAAGFLVAKAPQDAVDELRAMDVLVQLRTLRRARAARATTATVRSSSIRELFPPPGRQARQAAEAFGGTVTTLLAATAPVSDRPGDVGVVESGPLDEGSDYEPDTFGRWLALARRPVVGLVLALLVVALAAWRSLFAGGSLLGGALLPAPDGSSDLWSTYTAAWHPISLGSATPSPPYLAVLAGFATVLLGKAGWAVAWLLVLAIPLSGLLAYIALGPLGVSRRLRVWASAAYALTPALLGGIAQGRLGTAALAVTVPLIGLAAWRTLGTPSRPGTWRATATLVLLLAVAEAFTPVVWLATLALAVAAGLTWVRDLTGRLRLLAVVVGPALLLVPWSGELLRHPSLVLLEAGTTVPAPVPRPWGTLFLSPGGVGAAPVLLGVGIVVAGLAAVLRIRDSRLVPTALMVAAVGFVLALVTATVTVTPPASAVTVPTYPGPALVLTTAGLIVAALGAARNARNRLTQQSLGWRQPATVVVAGLALLAPLGLGLWWVVRGADGPLHRGDAEVLPAFVAASSRQPDRVRTLVLQPFGGRLYYSVLRADDPRLGDAELQPPASSLRPLDDLVSQVASGSGVVAATDLGRYAIKFVLLPAPVDADLERTLDSVPGLIRVANPEGSSLWQVSGDIARMRLAGADGSTVATLPAGVVDADPAVPASPGDTVVLADRATGGWRAVDAGGTALTGSVRDGWAQQFLAPTTSGTMTLTYRDPVHTATLWLQLVLVVVTVVLALPGRRRDDEGEVDVDLDAVPADSRPGLAEVT